MAMTREQFLKAHPVFAETRGKDRDQFLKRHPQIADAWERVKAAEKASEHPTASVGGAANAQTQQTAPAAPDPASVFAQAQQAASAREYLRGVLDQWGLGALGDFAWSLYTQGTPETAIVQQIRGRDEYKTRFAGLARLQAKGRPISESEYIGLERSYARALVGFGLPKSFYDDPSDFAALIGEEVSPEEFSARLGLRARAYRTDPRGSMMRSFLAAEYGMADADGYALAFWIDPGRGRDLLEQQVMAAEASAASQLTGFGTLTRQQAELAGGSGRDVDAVFAELAPLGALTSGLPGDDEAASRDDLLAAGFSGDAAARDRVERVQRRRTAAFRGGGGYATTNQGVTGLGTSDG